MNDNVETQLIKAVIQDYTDGTYEADAPKLAGVFHREAVMNGYLGPDLILAKPDLFIQDITSSPSMKSNQDPYIAEIEQIRIDGHIANVILSESGFRGSAAFANHFHLIKTEGAWKIISKLFTTIDRP